MMSMRFRTEHQRDAFFLIIIVTIAAFLILTGGWMYMIAVVGVAAAGIAIARWRRKQRARMYVR